MTGVQVPHRICFLATGAAPNSSCSTRDRVAVARFRRPSCILRPIHGAKLEQHGVPVTCLNASRTTSAIRILARFMRCEGARPRGARRSRLSGAMLARPRRVARIPLSSPPFIPRTTAGGIAALRWPDGFTGHRDHGGLASGGSDAR
jgi:hypothetical protein